MEVVVVWPWEHLAIGYLGYSLLARYLGTDRPRAADAAALAVGTQFPDLVDKPLGWATTLLPSGLSLAHSLLVAVPVTVATVLLTRAFGHGRVGVAFAVGYLLHLPGDAVYPLLLGGELRLGFLFWPVVAVPASTVAVLPYVRQLAAQFLVFLSTPRGTLYLLLEIGLVSLALYRWHADGLPGVRRRSSSAVSGR